MKPALTNERAKVATTATNQKGGTRKESEQTVVKSISAAT